MADTASQHASEPGRRLDALAIDRDAEVPIGVQLAWALRTRIADGGFKTGQRLPGLRELADAIGVNLNTVRTVYQRLEHEGLIESLQGSGTFVAQTCAPASAVGSIAASAARAAHETGVDPREVAAALYVAPEPPAQSAEEAADLSSVGQRQLLRRQIAAFESALGEIEAANPGVAPPPPQPARVAAGPALLGTRELEQVRTGLVRRLAAVQAAIDARDRQDTGQDPPAPPERRRKRAPQTHATDEAASAPKRPRRRRATARTLPAGT